MLMDYDHLFVIRLMCCLNFKKLDGDQFGGSLEEIEKWELDVLFKNMTRTQ